jgi:predicted transcriptional regulator
MLLSLIEPPKGTEAWWRWSDQKGLADIEAGRYVHIQNEKELKELFSRL